MSRLLLCLLVACDALDGHIDDPSNCCEAVTAERIAACLSRFTEPGHCKVASCVGREITVCAVDGGLP